MKTREEDAAKDKRIRVRERVKRLGLFVGGHRFGRTSEGQVKVMKTGD